MLQIPFSERLYGTIARKCGVGEIVDVLQAKQYSIAFCIFVIGMIIGRLSMAIQYEVMGPK